MARVFAELPEALARTVEIAGRCQVKIEPVANPFPEFRVPRGESVDSYFEKVVRKGFAALAAEVAASTGTRTSAEQVASGFLRIAVANMANAIKKISVQRGRDVTDYVLTTFGGAGGPHACAVADALGIGRILVPPLAGVLSAYGLGLADTVTMRERALDIPLEEGALPAIEELARELEADARSHLADEGIATEDVAYLVEFIERSERGVLK